MDPQKNAEGQWTLSVREAYGLGWVVIGWNDLVDRLKEMDLADAMITALQRKE